MASTLKLWLPLIFDHLKWNWFRRDVQTDTEEELDERDEDMVDDIVDLLYSRKYGKEAKEVDSRPLNAEDANYDKKLRREARRQRREAKKAKKERKRAKASFVLDGYT